MSSGSFCMITSHLLLFLYKVSSGTDFFFPFFTNIIFTIVGKDCVKISHQILTSTVCTKCPNTILCLISRTTVTSARIPEEDACHRVRNLCVFSLVQKETPGLTHEGVSCSVYHLERSVTSWSFLG